MEVTAMARRLGERSLEGEQRVLFGWGRTAPSVATVLRPASADEVTAALEGAPARGLIARGLGRSYGDLAQNGGGVVLDMTALNAVIDLDEQAGTVRVEAGCSLAALIEAVLPRGWFLPVTPGTRFVTVGGAVACDVHGKNHHRDGGFGEHVLELTLRTPAGETLRLDPKETPEEFWATVGGLGLTGVILACRLRLLPVATSLMSVDVERSGDLDTTLSRLEETDHLHRYSVAWLDCLARGARFGRALLMQGDHASIEELPIERRRDPLALRYGRSFRLPARASFAPLIRSPVALAFNELRFRRARLGAGLLQTPGEFFYPLDALLDWNRVYGRRGFVQYQFVLPFGEEELLRKALQRLRASAWPVLVVLKRFGASAGPLGFPLPGWTAAIDLPASIPGLGPLLDELDTAIAAAGGRVYLAKDARLRPERLAEMYPRLDGWREQQARLDPRGVMQCDLSRRLGLDRRSGRASS
ncbi:MAG: FAD-binding protein [Gaiellaceae bacterium]